MADPPSPPLSSSKLDAPTADLSGTLSPLHMKVLNFLGEDTPPLHGHPTSVGAAEASTEISTGRGGEEFGSSRSTRAANISAIGSAAPSDLGELFSGSFINRTDWASYGIDMAETSDTGRELQTMQLGGGTLVGSSVHLGSSPNEGYSRCAREVGAHSVALEPGLEILQRNLEFSPAPDYAEVARDMPMMGDTLDGTILFPASGSDGLQSLGEEAMELKTMRRANLPQPDDADNVDVLDLGSLAPATTLGGSLDALPSAQPPAHVRSQHETSADSPWERAGSQAVDVSGNSQLRPRPQEAHSEAQLKTNDMNDTCEGTMLFSAHQNGALQSLGKDALELKTLRCENRDLLHEAALDFGIAVAATSAVGGPRDFVNSPARCIDRGSMPLARATSPWNSRDGENASASQSFKPRPRTGDAKSENSTEQTEESHVAGPTLDAVRCTDVPKSTCDFVNGVSHLAANRARQEAAKHVLAGLARGSAKSEAQSDTPSRSTCNSPPRLPVSSAPGALPPPRPRSRNQTANAAAQISISNQQRRGGEEVVVESPHAVRDRLQRLHARQQRQHRAQSANSALVRPPVPPGDAQSSAVPAVSSQAPRPVRSANSSPHGAARSSTGGSAAPAAPATASRPTSRLPRPRSSNQVDGPANQAESHSSRPSSVGRGRVPSTAPSSARRESSKRSASAGPPAGSRSAGGVQSNRKLIRNALERYCLKGDANREQRESILRSFDEELSSYQRFVILFRSIHTGRHDLRALYGFHEQAWIKVLEVLPSPPHLDESMVAQSLRYDSGGKEFREIPALQESLNVADAVFMHPQHLRKSRLAG